MIGELQAVHSICLAMAGEGCTLFHFVLFPITKHATTPLSPLLPMPIGDHEDE